MPAISRDKSHIAFICDAMGNPDLFILPYDEDAGAGTPRQIYASVRGTQGSPVFSPDSRKIAFVSNKDGNPRIYIMDVPAPSVLLKEMKPRLLSKACRENTSPTWSPDGKKIAYAGLTAGVRQIWVYDLDSETEEQITFDKGSKENPSWAKDSFHIVFNAELAGGKAQLGVTNLNQRETVLLTEGSTDKRFPCAEPLVK
jgi:TolB protein